MQVRCPHCRSDVEGEPSTSGKELSCPSCGADFRVEAESTLDWTARDGRKIGRFELIEAVGRGAFGTMYRARDPELNRIVAVKGWELGPAHCGVGRSWGQPTVSRVGGVV
jgi:hypothetical protein